MEYRRFIWSIPFLPNKTTIAITKLSPGRIKDIVGKERNSDLKAMLVLETKYPLENPRMKDNIVDKKDCSKENTMIFFKLKSIEKTGGYRINTHTTGTIKNAIINTIAGFSTPKLRFPTLLTSVPSF
jgi:hypothetical protein